MNHYQACYVGGIGDIIRDVIYLLFCLIYTSVQEQFLHSGQHSMQLLDLVVSVVFYI